MCTFRNRAKNSFFPPFCFLNCIVSHYLREWSRYTTLRISLSRGNIVKDKFQVCPHYIKSAQIFLQYLYFLQACTLCSELECRKMNFEIYPRCYTTIAVEGSSTSQRSRSILWFIWVTQICVRWAVPFFSFLKNLEVRKNYNWKNWKHF